MCRLVYGPVNLVVCERVHVFMLCMLCVHVQLIKELLSDGSHPVTSKPQESFTSVDLWVNSAALSEQEQDDIADKDRQDVVVLTPTHSNPHLTKNHIQNTNHFSAANCTKTA